MTAFQSILLQEQLERIGSNTIVLEHLQNELNISQKVEENTKYFINAYLDVIISNIRDSIDNIDKITAKD